MSYKIRKNTWCYETIKLQLQQMSHKILLLSQKLERNKKIRYLILFTKLPKEFSNNTSMIQYILLKKTVYSE